MLWVEAIEGRPEFAQEAARYTEPPLTTVRQPIEEMGRQATRLLLAKMAGEATRMHLILDVELVVRASA